MASNFTFVLVTISEVNENLVLLAQMILQFFSITYYFGLVRMNFKYKGLYFYAGNQNLA